MAKYTVTHICGHEKVHQIYGKNKGFGGREEKLDWLRDQLCIDCYKEEQAKEREATNAAAAKENANAGLPALEGSEKQVAWAESIRAKCLAELKHVKPFKTDKLSEQAVSEVNEWQSQQVERIKSITDASWWIDNRDSGQVNNTAGWIGVELNNNIATISPTAYAEWQTLKNAKK